MRKRMILMLCMILVLGGCKKESDNTGVYYQKISEYEVGQVYNSMALYMCELLYYNGKIYTSTMHYRETEKEDLDCDTILGDEIGNVFGNHYVFWATDEDKLAANTGEGKIYQINGYDEDFRIAVYYEAYHETLLPPETSYNVVVFERLNDITLHRGDELFEDRLHLSESATVRSDTKEEGVWNELSAEDAAIKEFLDAMNDGVFLNTQDEEYLSLGSLQGYPLSFCDSLGLVTKIMVYEEGYVSMEQRGGKAFVLKMDADKCESILEKMYFGE